MLKAMFSSGIRAHYAVLENPTFSSDPWRVYPAKRNKDGKIVSVFILEKKRADQSSFDLIKYEISQLAKLKHPQVLTVLEPLEETKLKFLFVTEPVVDNLATVQLLKLDDLTKQKGLLQISKGLQFLHNYCSIVHQNLQPLLIYINDQGDWKLAGFRFLSHLNEISALERDGFYVMNNSLASPLAKLNMNFTAPELILDTSMKLGLHNDIFSLGCLIHHIYNNGQYLIECFDPDSVSDYSQAFKRFENKFYSHTHTPSELKYVLQDVPDTLFPIFPHLLARYPHDRMVIDQFIDCDFFNGSIIKAMWFVDEFHTKSTLEKLIFMRGILQKDENDEYTLTKFPVSFRTLKFLPLMVDLIANELKVITTAHPITEEIDELITGALKIVLKIGLTFSNLTFQDKIYAILLKDNQGFWKKEKSGSIFKLLIPASPSIRLALIEDLEVLLGKLTEKQLCDLMKTVSEVILSTTLADKEHVANQIRLEQLFFQKIALYISSFDFPYVKNTYVPLICQVFQQTTLLSTKLAIISSFKQLINLQIIDKPIVTEQLLPILSNVKSRDKSIVQEVVNLFQDISGLDHINLDLEVLVNQVLPQCWLLAFGCNNCTQSEFKGFVLITQKMEKILIEKKLKSLSNGSSNSETGSSPANGNEFISLVNSQKLNYGTKEEAVQGPLTKSVLQPRVASSPVTTPVTPKQQIRNSTDKSNGPNNHKSSRWIQASPDKLLPQPPITGRTFGATSTNSKRINNDALLQTLNNSTPKQGFHDDIDDDEFDDFQSTTASPSVSIPSGPSGASGSALASGGIDWSAEVRKTIPMNQLSGQQGGIMATPSTPPLSNISNPGSKLPPGFSSQVLTPTSGKKPMGQLRSNYDSLI